MIQDTDYRTVAEGEFWNLVIRDLDHLLSADDATITTLANASALLFRALEKVNWVGFYLLDGQKLVLGPFQGKPACTEIAIGAGVCGRAAQLQETVVVDDVNSFPGHIVCDQASRSEIVLPIIAASKLFGVLDIDSPELARFKPNDRSGLETAIRIITGKIRPERLY